VSASEIPQILGLSPYGSAFDLWWSKRLGESGSPDTRQTSRGRRVEPLVVEDFGDNHPEFAVRPCGLIQNVDRPYQLATPDGLAYEQRGKDSAFSTTEWAGAEPVAVIEAKTAGGSEGWGTRGTDEIPVAYRAQVLWQMDTLGLEVCWVPVWVGFDYREYVVTYDPDDVFWMREQAIAFLRSVSEGIVPDIDAHPATTQRLKALHPTVVEGEVEVSASVVAQYLAAKRLRDTAQERMDLAENRLRYAVGDYQRGVVEGVKALSRSVYDVQPRTQVIQGYTVNRLNVNAPRKAKRIRHAQPPPTGSV
jgi:putative phage-type endonuclease